MIAFGHLYVIALLCGELKRAMGEVHEQSGFPYRRVIILAAANPNYVSS